MAEEEILVEEPLANPILASAEQVAEPVAEPVAADTQGFSGSFRMSFTPQEFVDLYDTFDAEARTPTAEFRTAEQGFAFNLVKTLSYDPYLKDKMNYNDLRTGSAPILSELGLENKSLTDKQIIELFAQDDQGRAIEADPEFFEGVQRRALPGSGFMGGFYYGAKGTNLALSTVPPVTPWTAALRIGAPLVVGTITGTGASFAGERITTGLMGSEPIVIPGASAYEAGKTFSDTLPWLLTPWMAGREGFNLGGTAVLNNLNNFIGPMIKGQTRNPLSARFVRGAENLSGSMGRYAYENPVKAGLIETGALIGTTLAAGKAEDVAPGNPWVRFGFEATGGVSGALVTDIAANKVPALAVWSARGIKALYNKLLNKNPDEMFDQYGIGESDFLSVSSFITDQLEKNGEDPLALLEMLNDPKFDRLLTDESGAQIELDPATRAASITLLGLQNQFASVNPAVGNDAKSRMVSSIDALRRGLLALYADGSEESLQDAAIIQTSLFEATLESQLASATNKTIEAFKRVRGDDSESDLTSASELFETLKTEFSAGRAQESLLYGKIKENLQVNSFIDETGKASDTPNFITSYEDNMSDLLPETRADFEGGDLSILKRFVQRKREELGIGEEITPETTFDTGVTIGELRRARSSALAISKKMYAESKDNEGRIAANFADAILADMNSMPVGISREYDTARSFSAAFNDVFTRAYAGDVLGTKKNGAPSIPIATLANNLMKGDAAFMKAAALDGIAQFQAGQALTNVLESETGGQFSAQGQALTTSLKEQYDPVTGVINLDKMRLWYSDNKDLIESIPGLNKRISDSLNTANSIRASEENILRTIRADALNEDGSLNTTALSTWMNKESNKRLLDMFPSLRADLLDARKASNLIGSTREKNKISLKNDMDLIGLNELLPDKTSNATTAITSAISANQQMPFAILNRYMKMIERSGEDGFTVGPNVSSDKRFQSPNVGSSWTQADLKNGMRSALYNSIFQVTSNGERFSPAAAFNKLFVPHKNGKGVSIADWMLSNDLIGKPQLDDTRQFLKKMAEIEMFTMKAKPGQTDEFYKDLGEGAKLIAAMGGSAIGSGIRSKIGLNSGAGEIIFAGRFARFGQGLAERYFAELPASLQANRVQMILENEVLLRKALKTGKTDREKSVLAAEFADMAVQSYIISPVRRIGGEIIQETSSYEGNLEGEIIPPTPPPEEVVPNPPANSTPMEPPSGPAPSLRQPVSAAPQRPPVESVAPQRQAATQSGPVDRARFAALFPEDRELMGIGSLMENV